MIAASLGRVWALALRHHYLLHKSPPRLLDMVYWPTMDLLLWGLLTAHLAQSGSPVVRTGGALIAGVLLWQVLARSKFGVSVSFFEELWSRNLGHLFVSPLTPTEMIGGLLLVSIVRTTIGVGITCVIAWAAFSFDVVAVGPSFVLWWGLLAMLGWSIGIMVAAMVLRYGLSAEYLGWYAVFVISPISGIYYPIATLPDWAQPIAWTLPSAHVFEGMRQELAGGGFAYDRALTAFALDLAWLGVAAALFGRAHRAARAHGKLLQIGE